MRKLLKTLGQPLYYLFLSLIITISAILLLVNKLLHLIKVPRPTLPHFSIKVPRPKKIHWKLNPPLIIIISLVALSTWLIYYYIFMDLPSVKLLVDSPPSLTTKIYDRSGTLLYQIYKDENRSLIKLSDLPPHVVNATLAAEDKNFYSHHGIDFIGILRATYRNIVNCQLTSNNCTPEGGSTITQQLIKNTLLTPEKTLQRKLKELVLSIFTEAKYSKDQILEMYLNQVGYGGTAYGIEQASWQLFHKHAVDLTLAEAAFVAGLPIAPTTLSPFGTNPQLAKIRQQQVLENMVNNNFITENEKITALNATLSFHPQETTILAPHFVMYVKNLLVEQYGEDVVARGGLSVTTTLDLSLHNTLQTAINSELAKLSRLNVTNSSGLILNPQNGEILAMVGSRDFFDTSHDGQVNVTLQPRQPGSSIKPITYALAFSHGSTPASMIDDSPICFRLSGQPDYCPQNYDGRFHGKVSLRTALASSYNVPAIKLLNSYGIDNMIELAQKIGITTWDDPSRFGLSLTLGGGEVTMLDLSSVYSAFANSGIKVTPNSLLSVVDAEGNHLPLPTVTSTSVIEPAIAYQINSVLSDPLARSPAFGTRSVLNVDPNVAVKTGTTNNLRDNWTFGYTPDYLVSVWVGNNDNSPMSSVASGITGASPIWASVMKKLISNNPTTPFSLPSNLVRQKVSCNPPRYEYLVPGSFISPNCNATPSGTLLETASATSLH